MRALSRVQLLVAPWTVVHQAPLSMGLSRQEYWSRLAFPTPGDLPDPGIKPHLLCLLRWPAGSSPLAPPWKPLKRGEKRVISIFPITYNRRFQLGDSQRVFPVQVRERELNQTGFFCYPSPGSETLVSQGPACIADGPGAVPAAPRNVSVGVWGERHTWYSRLSLAPGQDQQIPPGHEGQVSLHTPSFSSSVCLLPDP